MVFHDLNGADVIVSYAVCRNSVFSAQEVISLNVELVDVYALILYFPVVGHIYAGHTFQHITVSPLSRMRSALTVTSCNWKGPSSILITRGLPSSTKEAE